MSLKFLRRSAAAWNNQQNNVCQGGVPDAHRRLWPKWATDARNTPIPTDPTEKALGDGGLEISRARALFPPLTQVNVES